ncbi:DUF3667 domain-containing protein [Neolewinella aurantiaca]|uniref:DUF3667 domain-containing protein n=1 Tax=Neolewinella aurantiaca TaxID=2602767 RepID=A0A5C7FS25_9BACT|nr:DUF3667 domain-containing protein [Neolewinella aurantiaca]TXF90830.1 DUF3667 domain-containing protein [Neolewinella aurantiaca]
MSTTCLNCQTEFTGNFCPECGQRSNVERFTFPYFFSREFLSATFNLERGFFHTCLNLAYRPGHMIREYLSGRRKEYFNFITFLLVLLTVEAVLWSLAYNSPAEFMRQQIHDQMVKTGSNLADNLTSADVISVLANQKFLFILAIPLAAAVPWLVFKRTGFNYLEHIIAVCFLLAMNTLLGMTMGILGLFPLDFGIYSGIYMVIANVILVFDFALYWQLSRQTKYTNGGRLWRTLAAGLSVLIVISMTLQFAIGILVGYKGKMEADEQQIEVPLAQPEAEPTVD